MLLPIHLDEQMQRQWRMQTLSEGQADWEYEVDKQMGEAGTVFHTLDEAHMYLMLTFA